MPQAAAHFQFRKGASRMYRFLLSAVAIFVLIAATLFSSGPVLARTRCGVKMPVTLLSLYRNSEFIYIGRYDKLEEGEAKQESEH